MEISNKRCIQILKLLLKNKACMTGDNLAVAIRVSSRSIRNDMKDLNRAGVFYNPDFLQAYSERKKDRQKYSRHGLAL